MQNISCPSASIISRLCDANGVALKAIGDTFFARYARCKAWLNLLRGRPGRNACDGWCEVHEALARALPRDDHWHGPPVPF